MKYISVNNLSDFEFHDSYWMFCDMDEDHFSVCVKHLNIHKSSSENPYEQDMEINNAKIIFYGYRIQAVEESAWRQFDDKGTLIGEKPAVVFSGQDAEDYFFNELKQDICLNGLSVTSCSDSMRMDLEAKGPRIEVFSATINAQRVTVEWDTYNQPAWYER